MADTEQWNVRQVLEWTTGHLAKHGSDTPRLDAEVLLAHARNCQRIELYTRYDEPLKASQREVMRNLVRRRAADEPVAYLVGHREFFGLDFRVSPAVLIPRPDTEALVMAALDVLAECGSARVLDVGTGCGCIAVAIAVNAPAATLTAIDIDDEALSIARQNARAHDVAGRIRFLQGDMLAALSAVPAVAAAQPPAAVQPPTGETFDLIVSNPPYIREDELPTIPPDVRRHEPHRALSGGASGLELTQRLIRDAPAHLVAGGRLLIEISPEQANDVCRLSEDTGEFREVAVINDLAGRKRVVSARRIS